MNPLEVDDQGSSWNNELADYTSFIDFDAPDFYWTSSPTSASGAAAVSLTNNAFAETGMKRRREKKRSPQSESKACRERLRREKMNDKFAELCLFLHPERPAKADKSAILGDAISALNKLQCELQLIKQRKIKLQHEIQNLKSEKNELKQEKLKLKATKENMELKIKGRAGFVGVQVQPSVYQSDGNKLMAFSGYAGFPMYRWIPRAVLDTSQDHVLRPPVA